MPTIKHILFPFDFSNQAMLTAPFVRAVAEKFDATVTLIGVAPPVWVPTSGEMPVLVEVGSEEREKDLRLRLDRALHPEFAGLTVARVTALGDPARKIVEYAQANAVDLIMMPTHGLGIFRSMLIGSVTAKVLHDAKCPVWTAAHAEEQRGSAVPRTIMCAIDGPSDETAVLVRWATEFSKRMKATLRLLHVVPPVSDWIAIPSERELHAQLRQEAQVKLESFLKQTVGPDVTVRVVVGRIAETVTAEAKQEGADLIVTGRGAAPAALGRLRSDLYGIVQQSPCPVLSV
jgi:nucleotide-binding universal stress UspA family protein